MTRELAILEIPVISIYQAEMLSVDKYLIDRGLLTINPGVTLQEILSVLNSATQTKKNWRTLDEGNESFILIKNLLINLKND
jgi:hypothetical protein